MYTYVVGRYPDGSKFFVIRVSTIPQYHIVAECQYDTDAVAIATALNAAQ